MSELLALFGSAFLAATLLPVPSEAVLGVLATAEGAAVVPLVVVATAGNTLGALLNHLLGREARRWRRRRWFPVSRRALVLAARCMRKRGRWVLLFAWLPVVGDPLTFAAGLLRVPTGLFLVLVATGKAARYVAVVAAARALI